MAASIEKILNEVRSLPPAERQRLAMLLSIQEHAEARHKTIEELVAEQGTRPLNFDELLGDSTISEGENVDEFLAELGRWRSQQSSRRID